MPKTSKATASTHMQIPGVFESYEQNEDGWTVSFESHSVDGDGAFLFKGGKDDQCQAAHMGYVVKGRMGVRMADGTEVVTQAGEAYFIPPGHTPVFSAGTEIVDFTRTDQAEQETAVVMPNLKKYLEEQGIAIPTGM